MLRYRSHIVVILAALLLGCSRREAATSGDSTHLGQLAGQSAARCDRVYHENGPCVLWGPSLIELIARPELYDGKRVRVIGFVNFEFEGNGFYLAREDWRQSILRNGLWIEPPPGFESDSAPSRRQPNQRYAIVEATFHRGPSGHFGMWSGSLDHVTRLDPWGADTAVAARTFRKLP